MSAAPATKASAKGKAAVAVPSKKGDASELLCLKDEVSPEVIV
jgi:hypothetical protein